MIGGALAASSFHSEDGDTGNSEIEYSINKIFIKLIDMLCFYGKCKCDALSQIRGREGACRNDGAGNQFM
jgi:hypothetical protein